jgi:hypothetical protein
MIVPDTPELGLFLRALGSRSGASRAKSTSARWIYRRRRVDCIGVYKIPRGGGLPMMKVYAGGNQSSGVRV